MTNAVTVAQGGSNNVTMRNRFINGQMQIAQRGTSFTASGYSLDRWYLVVLGSSTITQSSNAPAGFTNSLLWTTNSASTPANVAYYNGFSQMGFSFGKQQSFDQRKVMLNR